MKSTRKQNHRDVILFSIFCTKLWWAKRLKVSFSNLDGFRQWKGLPAVHQNPLPPFPWHTPRALFWFTVATCLSSSYNNFYCTEPLHVWVYFLPQLRLTWLIRAIISLRVRSLSAKKDDLHNLISRCPGCQVMGYNSWREKHTATYLLPAQGVWDFKRQKVLCGHSWLSVLVGISLCPLYWFFPPGCFPHGFYNIYGFF